MTGRLAARLCSGAAVLAFHACGGPSFFHFNFRSDFPRRVCFRRDAWRVSMSAHTHSSYAAAHLPPVVPFRWDVTRRERLGRLIDGPAADSYAEFVPDLRACCARVVQAAARMAGRAGQADLLLVGRSPESLF